ncbi:MAG: hypothetical protein JXR76_23530 [Deltaproteobacteria bacterium]|nr:hypothetical protein [Deltaproteobacteria bacterium]
MKINIFYCFFLIIFVTSGILGCSAILDDAEKGGWEDTVSEHETGTNNSDDTGTGDSSTFSDSAIQEGDSTQDSASSDTGEDSATDTASATEIDTASTDGDTESASSDSGNDTGDTDSDTTSDTGSDATNDTDSDTTNDTDSDTTNDTGSDTEIDTGECVPDTALTHCSNNTPQYCDIDGYWTDRASGACSGSFPICESGKCICEEDTLECVNSTTPRQCISGSWVNQAACTNPSPFCGSTGMCICTELSQQGEGIDWAAVSGLQPEPTGGSVPDGEYVLIQLNYYGPSSQAVAYGHTKTMRLTYLNPIYHFEIWENTTSAATGNPVQTVAAGSAMFDSSAATAGFTSSCGDSVSRDYDYSYSAGELKLYSLYQSTHMEYIFQKQ